MKGRGGYDGDSSMHQLGEQVDAVYAKVQEQVDKYGRSPLKELEPEPLLRSLTAVHIDLRQPIVRLPAPPTAQ